MEEAEGSADDGVVDGFVGRNCGVFSLVFLLCLYCLRRDSDRKGGGKHDQELATSG